MKRLLLLIAVCTYFLNSSGQQTTSFMKSDESITKDELLAGGLKVALYVNSTTRQFYLSDGENSSTFQSDGGTVFEVIKSGSGIKLRNVKSGEFFGGSGSTIARTSSESAAKVFTPEKITSKVNNTAANADETRSYWLTFTSGSKYYLNTNTSGYKTVQYATGNGNWSTFYIYKVEQVTTYNVNIIPAPASVRVNGDGVLSGWNKADIDYYTDESLEAEAYILDITAEGIAVKSSTDRGKYYALLSLDQLAEQFGDALPLIRIEDKPRFQYRGFMLDVSRHFFTVEEVKKMLDVMARYKMNVFHWHLTDDQGWRAEIKQYPKLTTIGAQRTNSYETPITKVIENGWTYWTGVGGMTGKPYGPYFYTQDEMRDVVAYAAERQIDILPEIDMPGHFVAALAAYPEYSCTPNNPPTVWTSGGISSNVLNVANDEAVQFTKNILNELCEIFPYPYIHIGGDECPVTQWQNNAMCQELYAAEGFTNYRQLQTRFIKQISDFVSTKGKKLFCWNESVTASGADLNIMKETGATIMCWTPCESAVRKAVSNGLPAVVTEYNRGNQSYYINRRQCTDYGEPTGAGDGNDNVEGCYSLVPMPSGMTAEQEALVKGVQGTFWTEHVGTPEYLEYLALPRLICVAEAGWVEQDRKDWSDFRARMMEHTKWMEDNNYVYSNHWMPGYTPRKDSKTTVTPETSTVDNPKWYKIKFTNGSVFMQANGKTNLATVENELLDDSQFFALIGENTNNFKIYCADGTYINTKSATSTKGDVTTLLYSSSYGSTSKSFQLASHPNKTSEYVITLVTDTSNGINTWGGTGAGRNIGFYGTSDANCALVFQNDSKYDGPTAIADIVAAEDRAGNMNGKFLKDRHVVIYKNGQQYNTAGQRLR
ncbi:MAG: beta-N-acetylhexosaminidase [Bacteroidaceae bacterium]|nr:beta-N-acetylhexosaminidase [Bacteroidaceae bacterium]